MRKLVRLFFVLVLFLLIPVKVFASGDVAQIYFFYGKGCPHCAKVESYFDSTTLDEELNVDKREIYFNDENRKLYNKLLDDLNYSATQRGVPILISGKDVVIGDTPIISYFEDLKSDDDHGVVRETQEEVYEEKESRLTLLMVLGASMVDAVNPCAFAVLIILMSTILAQKTTKSPKKALYSGILFSVSIFVSYLLMGLGLYKAIGFSGQYSFVIKILGGLAILLGLFNLKDWLWYGKSFLMEVPLSWRPKLKFILQSVTNPTGAFLTGFGVSLFLLPCTSGPYIVILGMLAAKTQFVKAFFYLVIYNLVFVLPMVVITILVYKGLDPKKAEDIRKKRLKILHLIAGIVLICMGSIILLGWV